MNTRLFPALICVLALVLATSVAVAQQAAQDDPLEADGEAEPAQRWEDYTVKAYKISVFGGVFGGDEYLNLPVKSDRTQVEEGSDWVMGFDGTFWTPDELDYEIYDGPIKTIENGWTAGFKVGSYLTEEFHVDLVFSYSSSQAVLTMVNADDPENQFREEIDRDESVQIFRGAVTLMYDLRRWDLWGISPYFGFGFGGVLNTFSNLEDRGGLFLVGSFGLERHIAGSTSIFAQFDYTTFTMSRHELEYTETVAYTDILLGLSFLIDVVPPEVRALREAELEDAQRRR
jgi:hypothetical protein